ncbi:MAG: MBL fold metallo-hydrolase [Opitutaceae bacterium]|nr:MBL fold metallo-hydrolase [Opitutaceae bacterium]
MKIHALPSGPIQAIGYLLTESTAGGAILVDAPGGILPKIQPIMTREGCQLKEVWLTHGHWDHTQDTAKVKRETGARVRAHRDDRMLIETPELMEEYLPGGLQLDPVKIDEFLEQGQHIPILGCEIEVRHVPGHCPGNVLFYISALNVVLVGDALFNRSIGRTDLPGGDFPKLERSIREQIYTLPNETVILPGHGPRTTVYEEKTGNPFVAAVD